MLLEPPRSFPKLLELAGIWSPLHTPGALSGFTTGATYVVTGYYYGCALASGGVKCWGYNIGAVSGETPTATTKTGLTSGVTALSGSVSNACAIAAGVIKCWGENDFGQLGDGTTSASTTPVTVRGFR